MNESDNWKILNCDKCSKLLKLPSEQLSQGCSCPHCGASLDSSSEKLASQSLMATLVASMLESIPAADESTAKKASRQAFRLFPSFPKGDPAVGSVAGASGTRIAALPQLRTPLENLAKNKASSKRVPRIPESKVVQFDKPLLKTTDANMAVDPNASQPQVRRRRWKIPAAPWESPDPSSGVRPGFSWREFKQKAPWRMIGIGAVCFGLIFWVSVSSAKSNGSDYAAITDLPGPLANSEAKPLLTDTEKQPKFELAKRVLPVVRSFLEAPDASALEPLVREPERVLPMMRKYYTGGVQPPFAKADYASLPEAKDLEVERDLISVSLQTKDYRPYSLLLKQTPEGYKVDWECYVTYSDMPLSVFQATKPTLGTLFRVKVEPIAYFNQDFSNERTHRAYRIHTIDPDRVLYGYVFRGTYVERQLVESIGKRQDITCILRLNYPTPSSNTQQVEITQYVKRGWVLNAEDLKPQEVKVLPALSPQ
jgi:hypothetical protein